MRNTFKIIFAITVLASFAFIAPKKENAKPFVVVIDSAHGGKDNGMTFEGFTEKQIVEKISNHIKTLNTNENIVFYFTRDNDEFVSLQDRTAFVNKIKPNLLLSFHVNGVVNTNASGIEFYINKENSNYEKSKVIADRLNEKMTKNHNLKSRGVKEAKLFLIEKSEAPAVMVELGFLSNQNDRKYLTDEKEQKRMASTILEVIEELK